MFRSQLIIGGDFNTHLYLDTELDRYGGRVDKKKAWLKILRRLNLHSLSLMFGKLGSLKKESLLGWQENRPVI